MKQDRFNTALATFCLVVGFMSILVGRMIMGGILALIGFAIFYNRGRGGFNNRSLYEKQVKTDLGIEEIFEVLKDTDTPLGKPWTARHKGDEGDCIVLGPGMFKDCIVISRNRTGIVIKHITQVDNIIRGEDDEYRFEGLITDSDYEASPQRFSVFASFKLTSVMLVTQLYEIIRDMASGNEVHVPPVLENFRFYYYNSAEGWFRDAEGNDVMSVECSLHPFRSAVFDHDGNELASVMPHSFNSKDEAVDRDGFELIANGEHFGEIRQFSDRSGDGYICETEDGTYRISIFPACTRGNISSNYRIERDGRLMAVIAGSPKLIFEAHGRCRNEIIHSYDDDYLVLYAVLEVFLLTLNSRFLK